MLTKLNANWKGITKNDGTGEELGFKNEALLLRSSLATGTLPKDCDFCFLFRKGNKTADLRLRVKLYSFLCLTVCVVSLGRSEADIGVCYHSPPYNLRSFPPDLELVSWLDQVASGLRASCFRPCNSGLTDTCGQTWLFLWVLGSHSSCCAANTFPTESSPGYNILKPFRL